MSHTQWRGGTSPRDTNARALDQKKTNKKNTQNVWRWLTNSCPFPPMRGGREGRGVSPLANIVFEKEWNRASKREGESMVSVCMCVCVVGVKKRKNTNVLIGCEQCAWFLGAAWLAERHGLTLNQGYSSSLTAQPRLGVPTRWRGQLSHVWSGEDVKSFACRLATAICSFYLKSEHYPQECFSRKRLGLDKLAKKRKKKNTRVNTSNLLDLNMEILRCIALWRFNKYLPCPLHHTGIQMWRPSRRRQGNSFPAWNVIAQGRLENQCSSKKFICKRVRILFFYTADPSPALRTPPWPLLYSPPPNL